MPSQTNHSRWRFHVAWPMFAMALAFALCYFAGRRGFFPFDQSILFDGAYRIYLGQVPYRDFLIPVGPVAFAMQALFFHVFGVSYHCYLWHAAAANALATAITFRILWRCFPDRPAAAAIGSLVAAVWFYPQFGTPWLEQTAFLFALLALDLLVHGSESSGARLGLRCGLAGALWGIGLLSKQNAGLFAAGILLPALFLPSASWRQAAWRGFSFAGSTATVLGCFALWLFMVSDPQSFWQHTWVIPSAEGMRRLTDDPLATAFHTLAGQGPWACLVVSNLAVVLSLADLWQQWKARSWHLSNRPEAIGCVLTISAACVENLFICSMRNQPEVGFSLLGLVTGGGCASAFRVLQSGQSPVTRGVARSQSGSLRMVVWIATSLLAVWLWITGFMAAWQRSAHDVFANATFEHHCELPMLEAVLWGEPTLVHGMDIPCAAVAAVVEELRSDRRPFLVLMDFTLLYPMLGQAPSQPLVWFHWGLTYPREYDAALDERIVRSLADNHVGIVVMERNAWNGVERMLPRFPLLKRLLEAEFQLDRVIGPFLVLKKSDKREPEL